MHTLRTRFSENIVAEFLPPQKASSDDHVIIFCDGLPSVPRKQRVLEFWSKKGYWVIHPRYRGTWESGGEFLRESPDVDIVDIINELPNGLTSLWDNIHFPLRPKRITLIGASFGGPAALLASRDPRVTSVIAISPVIDWRVPSPEEPLETFPELVQKTFGDAYRGTPYAWKKLLTGTFYNPASCAKDIDGKKIYIIHAADDKVSPVEPVRQFVKDTGARYTEYNKGGHLSMSEIMHFFVSRRVQSFLKRCE